MRLVGKHQRRFFGFCVAALLMSAAATHAAEAASEPAAESAAPRFAIQRFEVDGNTLLKPAEIDAAVSGFTGAQKDFSDIQRALEALEEVYRKRGFGVAQVLLPEQDITKGVVKLRVI